MANHHTPTRVPQRELDVLIAVTVANVLAHEQENRVGIETGFMPLDVATVASLGVADRLPEWRAIAEERMNAICQGGEADKRWAAC